MTEDIKQKGEFSSSENWKLKHEMAKREVEEERDKWKDKYYEADKKLLDETKEKKQLKEELEEWERKDLAGKKISEKLGENPVDRKKQERLNNFLNRIK